MKQTLLAVLAVIAMIVASGAAQAEITTVILSENNEKDFKVSAKDVPTSTVELTFKIGSALPDDATVKRCSLCVIPSQESTRDNQDVTVILGKEQVGQWSVYKSQTTQLYTAELKPKVCVPGSDTVLTLKTESKYTSGEYYGGGDSKTANRPRLIVTYESPTRPTAARWGQTTDWAYDQPESFFSNQLWQVNQVTNGEKLLANPVSYGGAVYLVGGSSNTPTLHRLAGSGKIVNWPLDFPIDAGSFAFVTSWGRLYVITKDAIHSCELNAEALTWDINKTGEKITINPDETPAMGSDGSVYFKNVDAAGSIVAYNPSLKEIWRTELKLTKVSAITLSENGQRAYVLAEIPKDGAKMIALLRINTATGETITHEIEKPDRSKPQLNDLLRPAVSSKTINQRIVDYVFVAGNTSDTGLLQLVVFEPPAVSKPVPPKVAWTRDGKVACAPVISVDGNSLFAVQESKLKRYPWSTEKGAVSESAMKEQTLSDEDLVRTINLLVDSSDSAYLYADQSLLTYQSASKKTSPRLSLQQFAPKKMLFTTDGSLIGYDDWRVYNFSPKAAPANLSPSTLATGTIYSADGVTVAPDAADKLKDGDKVLLKGSNITLPKGFKWPQGKTLKVQTMHLDL